MIRYVLSRLVHVAMHFQASPFLLCLSYLAFNCPFQSNSYLILSVPHHLLPQSAQTPSVGNCDPVPAKETCSSVIQ